MPFIAREPGRLGFLLTPYRFLDARLGFCTAVADRVSRQAKEQGRPLKTNSSANNIPKIIHQTWKTSEVPERCRAFQESWKKFHPDWEYRLWTDEDNEAFIKTHYPWFFDKFRSYPRNIQRADVVRYFILYHYGGLYVDLDFECLRPFDNLMSRDHTCFFGEEPSVHSERLYAAECEALYGKAWVIGNELMASVPGHPFWVHLFEKLGESQSRTVIDSTGPRMLTHAYMSFDEADKSSIKVYDEVVFFPLVEFFHAKIRKRHFWRFFARPILTSDEMRFYREMYESRKFPDESYAVHYWFGSWANKQELEILTQPYGVGELLTKLLRKANRKLRKRFRTKPRSSAGDTERASSEIAG